MMNSGENLWLPRRGVCGDAELRLFCFPHAGGGGAVYHRWSRELPPQIDVVPVLLPGRERRLHEAAPPTLGELVTGIADALEPYLRAAYAIFGQSMGALIGFELLRELRRRAQPLPRHFFAAAYRAPQLSRQSEPLHELPDAEFLSKIQERFAGIPPEIARSADLLSLFLPILRADVRLIETYRYYEEPPLACPITALGGADDHQVSIADLAAWRTQTSGEFRQKLFSGGHFFVTTRQTEVLRVVRSAWERSNREQGAKGRRGEAP